VITHEQFERWKGWLLEAKEDGWDGFTFEGSCATQLIAGREGGDFSACRFGSLYGHKHARQIIDINNSAPNHAVRVLRVIEYLESQVDPATVPADVRELSQVEALVGGAL
jgi:hypothetical protein